MLSRVIAKLLKNSRCAAVTVTTVTAIAFGGTATQAQVNHFVGQGPLMSSADAAAIQSASDLAPVGFFGLVGNDRACDASCDGCGDVACCCSAPWWAHRSGVSAQALLLRSGSTDQIYELEFSDATPAFPTGQTGRLNLDEELGFRLGFSCCASECTSLVGRYTFLESNTQNSVTAAAGNVLNSQIIHPDLLTTGGNGLSSSANYGIDFQMIDLAYRHIWRANNNYAINWLAGFQYGRMEQDLLGVQERAVGTGNVTVDTDVDFDGFGMLFGVDATRRSCNTGLMVYGRGLSSFLAGNWRGDYAASNQFVGGIVGNDYEDYRVTPVVELELGFGWQSRCGRCQATVGYMTSAWYNAVSTREYINAVRSNNLVSVDETITFNGLTAGLEARF